MDYNFGIDNTFTFLGRREYSIVFNIKEVATLSPHSDIPFFSIAEEYQHIVLGEFSTDFDVPSYILLDRVLVSEVLSLRMNPDAFNDFQITNAKDECVCKYFMTLCIYMQRNEKRNDAAKAHLKTWEKTKALLIASGNKA